MSEAAPKLTQQVRPHSVKAKVIHWGFIALFLYAGAKQLDEVDQLEDFALLQYEMIFAAVFLVVLITRFVYMHATRPSALPDSTPERTKFWARLVHLGMYTALASIAFTGLLIGGLYWSGTKSGVVMDVVLVLHEISVNVIYLLIIGHVVAAVVHRRKGDGIWSSMVPVWKERDL